MNVKKMNTFVSTQEKKHLLVKDIYTVEFKEKLSIGRMIQVHSGGRCFGVESSGV